MTTEGFVLMAEDDENDVVFLQRAFAQAEISIPCGSSRTARPPSDYLSGADPLPCLFMLDLKLPRKTGMEVLQWVRGQEKLHVLPVIMFSSSVHPAEMEAAYRFGANAFVTKPSGSPERTELARMIKGFWLTFNRTP